jgi:hypothetical protein
MSENDPTPVAADDFPEFAEPPQQRPAPEADEPEGEEQSDGQQAEVDAVIARLRRERAQES